MIRARLLVEGRVQGVGYRAFTVRAAQRRSLRGWVRNLPDGRVEIEAEGSRDNLEGLIRDLEQGPPLANVERVHVEWLAPTGEAQDFRIVY
ncbi:MAG: acylphosphatase [Nitrospirae bacterium]|nr:MAG: acylphosphatase [Nitrospirota bacterium]